ncbi:MAG TPA: alanine--tRNA ligase [Candidatus Saccharimonadales bacterium]
MNAQDIRRKYLDFFKDRGHSVIPRANLIPQDDPTTLFTGSGMQPLIQYLLGEEHPQGKRLVDSQTCLRAEDIEEVGDNRHTTFFEMLGNWSLGDYFKAEQLPWFFEFLTDEVGLDPSKLYVTCFIGDEASGIPKDDESAKIWQELFKAKEIEAKTADIGSEKDGYTHGMKPGERIFFYDASKNWWSRAGEPGDMPEGEPGGPDSEVFYDFGTEHDADYGANCHPNCDCGRFLEIGNSVFMEYVKTKSGFDKLPQRNVDFGGGLERIAAAAGGDPDVFKISLMWPVVEKLSTISGKKYEDHVEAKRIITDHLRAAVWLAADGLIPSNKEQGYVMRRLIRRAVLNAHELGIEHGLAEQVTPVVIDAYKDDFKEIADNAEQIVQTIAKEEKIFRQTLKKGLKEFEKRINESLEEEREKFNKYIESLPPDKRGRGGGLVATIGGDAIFTLYDTYGFPTELSLEEAKKRSVSVDKNWQKGFDRLMEEQKTRSRTATKGQFKGGLSDHSGITTKYHTATHLLYRSLRNILGNHVIQRGSNITAERTRFDFSHPDKMTPEQIKQVEDMVNEQIEHDWPVSWREEKTKEVLGKVLGAFGDKYGDTVKVYTMGDPDGEHFSREICGGPHVEHTGQLGEGGKRFKITKEQSSSAGVRRIKAVLK